MAYKSDFPNGLSRVHDVFHISQLRKYISGVSHVLQPETIKLDDSLSYEEKPIRILDSKVGS